MAIIIPSRSIYKIQNPKVRDNLVDKVEVAVTEVTPNNEYDVSVYNEDYSVVPIQDTFIDKLQKDFYDNISLQKTNIVFGYVRIVPYYNTLSINIPRIKSDNYINGLYLGKNNEGKDKIGYSLHYNKYQGNANITVKISNGSNIIDYNTYTYTKDNNVVESVVVNEFIIPDEKYIYTYNNLDYSVELKDIPNNSDLSGEIDFSQNENSFSFKIKILSGYDVVRMSANASVPLYDVSNTPNIVLNGIGESYIADNITITVNGDTIGIDLTDKTVIIGKGNKPLSFDGNELMQTTNRLNTAINGKTEAVEGFYTSTLYAFKNGKETATIRCSIGEYKDQSGNVVISPNGDKRIFKVGDEVIPMVYTNVGDKAMSNYKDGNDKIFKVLATNIHAQGVAWQDLTLQEK